MTIRAQAAAPDRRPATGAQSRVQAMPGSRAAHHDPRWPAICIALDRLREARRHAVRIVDTDCACGALLIAAVRQARACGFTAIEGRGIDGSPTMIGRARAAAHRLHDPAIGIIFEVADVIDALADEANAPADIILWHGTRAGDDRPGTRASLAAAGDTVIGDRGASDRHGAAI